MIYILVSLPSRPCGTVLFSFYGPFCNKRALLRKVHQCLYVYGHFCDFKYIAKIILISFHLSFIDKPSPPKGPAVQEWKTDNSKELRWNAPENDGGDRITEYVVERREKGKKSWKQVGLTQAGTTSIEIKGLKKDTSYDFRVSAKNSVGVSSATIIEETATSKKQSIAQSQSQASLATSASTTEVAAKAKSAPGAPRNVQVTAVTSLSVTLQWIPPASNGGADLTGYVIEKRIGTSHTWEKAATVDTSVTEYTVENLKEKCQYYLRVSAENEIGVGEAATTEKVVLKTSASKYTKFKLRFQYYNK